VEIMTTYVSSPAMKRIFSFDDLTAGSFVTGSISKSRGPQIVADIAEKKISSNFGVASRLSKVPRTEAFQKKSLPRVVSVNTSVS
jgi:hypothetical protein